MTPTTTLRMLFAACALATGVIVWMWLVFDRHWTPPPALPADAALLSLPPVADREPGETTLQEISRRPLFSPDRRPAEAVETATNNGIDPNAVRLIGLFASDPEGGAILLIDNKTLRIRLGEAAEGLTLREIGARHAVLVGPDGGTTRLDLLRGRKPATETDNPFHPQDDDGEDFPNHIRAPAQDR